MTQIGKCGIFLKFQLVHLGKKVKNELVWIQYLLIMDEWTSVKIFTGDASLDAPNRPQTYSQASPYTQCIHSDT